MVNLYPRKDMFHKEYDWKEAEPIDGGYYGNVFSCLHIPTDTLVALKKFKIPLNRETQIYT